MQRFFNQRGAGGIKWIGIVLVLLVVLLVVGTVVGGYNRFVRLDRNVKAQWAQVENQFQRRFDLIPNVVESVKGYLKQEQEIFRLITDARKAYSGAQTVPAKAAAASQLEGFLGRLLVIAEQNPQIKSDQTVQSLIIELEGAENRIAVERGRYNEAVNLYNTTISTFPNNVLAGWFGFKEHTLFQAQVGAETAPQVKLDITQ